MGVYRAAVVGCGRMGGFIDDEIGFDHTCLLPFSHAAGYVESPHTELVAGCDANEEKLAAWGERYGVKALYTSVTAMVDEQHPDFVSICTPTPPRCETALAVLAGKPKAIWIEKPMAETLRDCDRMIEAAREVGAVIAHNTSRRWHPIWWRAREIIEQDWIGPVHHVTGWCGGGISHMGSHLLDTVLLLVGSDVEWVTGHAHDQEKLAGEDDLGLIGFLHFVSGAHAYVNMVDPPWRFECEVAAERGRIRLWNNGAEVELEMMAGEGSARRMYERPFPRPARMTASPVTLIADLVHCVEHGGQPRANGETGRTVLEIALAMRESARQSSTPVPLPFADLDAAIRSV